jgi:hypothetical protein
VFDYILPIFCDPIQHNWNVSSNRHSNNSIAINSSYSVYNQYCPTLYYKCVEFLEVLFITFYSNNPRIKTRSMRNFDFF